MDRSPIEQIKRLIDNEKNFLLSGGAGSGKTYTLGEVLNYIYSKNTNTCVACITYTNVAADEIKERFPHYKNLKVSTIHDFLWNNIKLYQKNLRTVLYELIKGEKPQIKYDGEIEITKNYFDDKKIQYKEYRKIDDGIISHDEVIIVANEMFKKYSALSNIIKDKFKFILIDEYQDTNRKVIEILLEFLQKSQTKKNVLGFFGDSMQSIYDNNGIGDIKSYVEKGIVKEVLKNDNYRCSKKVIELINKIRNDSIQQKPAKKNEHGEITNKEGSIKFLYSNSNNDISKIKKVDIFKNWDFSNFKETKELYLTRKLIAKQGNFINLWNAYKFKDNLIGDSKDVLIKHLCTIKEVLDLYEQKNYRGVTRLISFKVLTSSDKYILKKLIGELKNCFEKSIDYVLNKADELNLIKKDENVYNFIKEYKDIYDAIKDLPFKEIISLNEYEKEKTPFSTQHGVKGTEFENVLIILDNGKWNNYNFKYLLENDGDKNIINRTKKLFYVCCSRAKNNLVVYSEKPTRKMLQTAQDWFGQDNVISI